MADHSQKWHDGTTSRNVGRSSSSDGLAALVSKLDNLGRDMKKLKENVYAIQVRYGEFERTTPFNESNGGKFHVGPPGYYTKTDNRPSYGERRQSLEELLAKNQEESARRSTEIEVKRIENGAKTGIYRTLQLRKEILNFRQLPTESVFEAWEMFKICLRKCTDHRILLLNQILTFYNGIMMIGQERLMVAAGGKFMRKTPKEAYDLIENMTQHHFQWDAELYYNTTTDMSAHYTETTFSLRERVEVLGKQNGYTIQSVQHNPGPGHPNTFYYSDSDESDDEEPSEMIEDQKSIHHLSGSPTPSSDPVVASLSPSLTPTGDSDSILEETDTLLPHKGSTSPEVDDDIFDPEGDIRLLERLLNLDSTKDIPPLHELNNEIFDPEGDILILENLLKDDPLEVKNSEIDSLIKGPSDTFLMGDEDIKLNPPMDVDTRFPIPRVSEKPLDSLDPILETFKTTITDPLFDFDSEFTLNSILDIQNKESDECETETIMDKLTKMEYLIPELSLFMYSQDFGDIPPEIVPSVPHGRINLGDESS
ncbi:hypothetical protein Tco_0531264 [Tanacetum coccineum]